MENKVAEVEGIRMRWEEAGRGPAVVFLHGIPTSPRLWRHVIPALPEAHCLAWEMVGYGGSIAEGRNRDISVARQAEYLVAWMRQLGLDRAVLVAHDLGGGVAQIAAVHHPERVAGLVLMNAIAYDSWPIPQIKAARAGGSLVERLPPKAFRLVFEQLIYRGHDRREMAQESMAEHWPFYASENGAADFVRQVRSLDVRDTLAISDRLDGLGIPARLVWGAADPFQKIGYGYRLAHDLNARLDRIEGGKHFVPEDHPEEVARTVETLLGQLARPQEG